MPSWNIHTAHVERLLHEERACNLGITDANCFLFGNYVPDVYVGHLVSDITHRIDYNTTHLTEPHSIPIPHEREFWDAYVKGRRASDVTLGAWAHLLCDARYNAAVRVWNAEHGVASGERTRIRKQTDFEKFGRTLPLTLHPQVSDELLEQCDGFPQYPIYEPDVRHAVTAANGLIDASIAGHLYEEPEYSLLTQDFFLEVFERVTSDLLERLRGYGEWLAGQEG